MVGAEDQMSYMYLLLARRGDPVHGMRLMDIPVEWRAGTFIPTGELQDRPARQADLLAMRDEPDCDSDPLPPIDLPAGWTLLARFWQPSRYVPQSAEVREEGERRARAYLKEMLGDE
jgi:hypothetical protein